MVYKTLSQKVSTGSSMPRNKKNQRKRDETWSDGLGNTSKNTLQTFDQWKDSQLKKSNSPQEDTETDINARGWGTITHVPMTSIHNIQERELESRRRNLELLEIQRQQESQLRQHLPFNVPKGGPAWGGSQSSLRTHNLQEIQKEDKPLTDKLKTDIEERLSSSEQNPVYIERFLPLLEYSQKSSKDLVEQETDYLRKFDLFKRQFDRYVPQLSAMLKEEFGIIDEQERRTVYEAFFPFTTLVQVSDFLNGDKTFVRKELIELLSHKSEPRHHASNDTAKRQEWHEATGRTLNSDEWTIVGAKKAVRANNAKARVGMPGTWCTAMQRAQGYGPLPDGFANKECYGGPYAYNTGFCPPQMQPQTIYCRAPFVHPAARCAP